MGEYPLSDTYVLDMIDQMDLKHATGIISFMVQFTELEFNVDVHTPTIRQHSMSFYETYPSPAWLPYTICRPSIHTRGISRTNVTTPTQIWSANPSLSLYEVYPGPTWLPCTKCRPSIHTRDISRTNVTDICHIRCANPSMSFYEVYPVQRDYANPSLSFYEVYPGPTWLRQPKYDPPTLHWVYTRYIQGQRDCHVRNADLQYILEIYPDTDVTAICHIRCANTSMSF